MIKKNDIKAVNCISALLLNNIFVLKSHYLSWKCMKERAKNTTKGPSWIQVEVTAVRMSLSVLCYVFLVPNDSLLRVNRMIMMSRRSSP